MVTLPALSALSNPMVLRREIVMHRASKSTIFSLRWTSFSSGRYRAATRQPRNNLPNSIHR